MDVVRSGLVAGCGGEVGLESDGVVLEGLELTFDGNFDTSCPSGDRLRLGCELRDRSFFELILSIEKSDLATITRDITCYKPFCLSSNTCSH